jgi:hypothetical protein
MKSVTKQELQDIIHELSPDLSSDMEGNNSNLLKAVFSRESDIFQVLLEMINKILEWGNIPPPWKNYYISLIEKKAGKIIVDTMSDQLRPIAITHEYAKLVSKILANRLNKILLEHDILNTAQRAFIRNGGTHQCISTLINILEDSLQKRRHNNHPLFLVWYDMRKAYDSVQFYSIRPTLERFNLPETFIKYIENIQFSLQACFKTFYGLTETFLLKTLFVKAISFGSSYFCTVY